MLRDGIGSEKDDAGAERHFRAAFLGFRQLEAERPDDMLQYRLGWMLLTGTGTEKDITEAERYFTLAARQNNVHAQYQLAKLIFSEPDPAPERMAEALGWMHKAAEAGLDFAQYVLGKFYLENEQMWNVGAALYWLTQAATPCEKNPQGNPYAQYRLGKLLIGDEVPKDIPAALHWLELAATQEHDGAAYQLGKLFLADELVEKNTETGLRWMYKSAEARNQYAQYALGKFFLFGDAGLRDEQAAVYWLTLSANQGNIYAAFLLEHREQWQRGSVLLSGTRLLSDIGRIFSTKLPPQDVRKPHFAMDRKRRKELLQKKDGKGIEQTDMEQQMSPM